MQSNMKAEDVDPMNAAFDLTPNNQATDLSFNMYSEKTTDSPANSLYRNNPDPYLGSGAHNGGRSSNGSGSHSGQDEFDLRTHQQTTFTAVSSDLGPSLPSYLVGNEGAGLGSNDSLSGSQSRNHSSNDHPGRFSLDEKLSDYRPSSANSFSAAKHNSGTDLRGSPIVGHSNQLSGSGVSSPISPSYYSGAQGSEKPPLNPFAASCYDFKSSAFKPLPNNQQSHAHSSYNHQNPSPQSYHHGPSPPMPGHFHQNSGYISAGAMDRNIASHVYGQSVSDYDYNSNFRKRSDLSIDNDHSNQQRPQPGLNQTNSDQPNHSSSESEHNKRVIVPAGDFFLVNFYQVYFYKSD